MVLMKLIEIYIKILYDDINNFTRQLKTPTNERLGGVFDLHDSGGKTCHRHRHSAAQNTCTFTGMETAVHRGENGSN